MPSRKFPAGLCSQAVIPRASPRGSDGDRFTVVSPRIRRATIKALAFTGHSATVNNFHSYNFIRPCVNKYTVEKS